MGTIKISEADKSYIKKFLKYDDKNIDKDWIVGASIGNIGVLGAAIYFLESKII